MNTVPIVDCPPTLRTSYGPRGKTRDEAGRVWPYDKLVTAEAMGKNNRAAWSCTPGTAAGLTLLDELMREKGSKGLRLTELKRSYTLQKAERVKFENWMSMGRPTPGTKGYSASTMRSTRVSKAGDSNHNWGGAVDLDVYALDLPGVTGDAALSLLWDLGRQAGFKPILDNPRLGQAECWHFDHLGTLAVVRDLFLQHRSERPEYREVAAITAQVGCILTGDFVGDRKLERLVQARLLLAGYWVGLPDGIIGQKTRAALEVCGIAGVTGATPAPVILANLDERRVGLDALAGV